jgi:hypothetical protein
VKHLVGAVAAFVVACGPVADSGVGQKKKLRDITDEDARKLCAYRHELDQNALGTERDYCMGVAYLSNARSEECEDAIDDCRADQRYAAERDYDPRCETTTAQSMVGLLRTRCDITVGEYENCLEAALSQWGVFTKTLTCDELDGLEPLERPVACRKVDDDCPGLVGR